MTNVSSEQLAELHKLARQLPLARFIPRAKEVLAAGAQELNALERVRGIIDQEHAGSSPDFATVRREDLRLILSVCDRLAASNDIARAGFDALAGNLARSDTERE